jgi:putative ubiquitin-RnfH superfamily antitoxin RatB of RatAB toxin-antitoxin module
MAEVDVIDVEVAYAEADKQVIVPLQVPVGTSAGEAVRRSGLAEQFPDMDSNTAAIGVFGIPVSPCAPLAQGDRVEIYRPLQVDPKEARRQRAARSRARRKNGA